MIRSGSVVAEVARPDPAETLVGREAKQSDRAGLDEHLARGDAVGLPIGDVGGDLLDCEIASKSGERAVVVVVVHPLHRRSVCIGVCLGQEGFPLSRHDRTRRRRMLRYSVVVTTSAEATATPYADSVDLDELRANLRL